MNELFRWIDKTEYDEGLHRRLDIGHVAVGAQCKLRVEGEDSRLPNEPIRYLEAAVHILDKRPIEVGKTAVQYVVEVSKLTSQPLIATEIFDHESILEKTSKKSGSGYLIDETDPRWDAGLQELVNTTKDIHQIV